MKVVREIEKQNATPPKDEVLIRTVASSSWKNLTRTPPTVTRRNSTRNSEAACKPEIALGCLPKGGGKLGLKDSNLLGTEAEHLGDPPFLQKRGLAASVHSS